MDFGFSFSSSPQDILALPSDLNNGDSSTVLGLHAHPDSSSSVAHSVNHLVIEDTQSDNLEIGNPFGYEEEMETVFEALRKADISSFYSCINPGYVPRCFVDYFKDLKVTEGDFRMPSNPFTSKFTPAYIKDSKVDYPIRLVPTPGQQLYFVPSQHFCFGIPVVPPENYPLWNSLEARAAHATSFWPSSKKPIYKICKEQIREILPVREVLGDYHYFQVSGWGYTCIIQLTDYELFCLGHHNPNARRLLGFVGRDIRYWLDFTYVFDISIVEYLLERSTHRMWMYLFYGSEIFCEYFKVNKFIFDKDSYEKMLDFAFDNIHNHDYLSKVFEDYYRFAKRGVPKYSILQNVELGSVKRWHSHFLKNKRRKIARNKKKALNIKIQGLTDVFKMVSNNEKREEVLASVNELGKLAATVNSAQDALSSIQDKEWYKAITSYIMSFAGYLSDLAEDFTKFMQNPKDYIFFLKRHLEIGLKLPAFTAYDATKTALILGASVALFEKSQILSIGLFLYGIHSFLNNCSCGDIIRPCAVIITLCYIGIMKAMQLRSASIEIQATSNLTEMIYATVTFVTLALGLKGVSKSPNSVIKHLFDSTKNLFAISRGTLALTKCVEFIIDAFKRCADFCFGDSYLYKALVKMSVSSDDLKDYIVYSMSMKAEDLTAKLTLDPEAKEEWKRMCNLHDSFLNLFASGKPPTENHIGYSMYSKACNSFIKLQEEYDKIKESLDYFRVEPFMIWLWGEPGVGKTWCRDLIINNTYAWHKAIDSTIDARKTGLLYVRNPADKYMSKYKGQFAVAYDDVGQNRQSDNPEFNELMGFGSTNQVQLNMADLQDKGRMFSSKVIIMAANTKNVNANELILSPNAFNRRRHIVIKLERPKTNSESLATSKSDFSLVRIVLSDPILGSDLAKFPNEGYGDNDQMFNDMFRWLAPKYWEHVTSQSSALSKKEQSLKYLLENNPKADIIRIDPKTGKVIEEVDIIPPAEDIKPEEYYDTVDTPDFCTPERIELYTKIRLARAVNSRFDEVCTLIKVSKDIPDFLRQQFDSMCKEILGRVLSTEEFIRMFHTNEFKMDPGIIASLKDFMKDNADQVSRRFPWIKFSIGLASLTSLVAIYKLCSSFFKKGDLFDVQGYSLETKAPRSTPVVVQSTSHEDLYRGYENLIKYAQNDFKDKGYLEKEKADKFKDLMVEREFSSEKEMIDTYKSIKRFFSDHVTSDLSEEEKFEKFKQLNLFPLSVQKQERFESLDSIEQVCFNLSSSMGRFSKVRDVKDGYAIRSMNGFNVAFKVWLIPRHFFGEELKDTPVLLQRDGKPNIEILLKRSKMIPYLIEKDGKVKEKDLVLVEIDQLECGKNHLKHFAKNIHMQNTRNFSSKMLKWDKARSRVEEAFTGTAQRWDIPMDLNVDGIPLYYSDGYSYGYKSEEGDCGSLLISIDRTTQSRIYGLHFGFDHNKNRGLSMNIPREDLEYLMANFSSMEKITSTMPNISTQACDVPSSLKIDNKPIFEFFGKVDDAPLPPKRHKDLFRSPLFDQVYPAEKDLSVLSMFDDRLDEEFKGEPDILTRGVIDFEHKSIPWPEYELDIAQEALLGEFNRFDEVIDRKVQSIDFALNGKWVDGDRLEHTEPLNLKTSSGYGLPGIKREHFVETEFLDEDGRLKKYDISILNPKLQAMVDDQWNDWMQGKTHPCIWSHALKSEPLKLSKIKTGNTRTFCVAQTSFLINVRRLFGSFTAAMKASKIKSFSCLGTDACSPDWNSLYNNLRSTGPKGVDLDFFKFDRTAVTWQLARRVCLAINAWYNDDIKYQRARLIAFEDMIFSYALIGKYLTRKRRGNPSGNPLTTELNNCVNYLMLCMVYLLIAKSRKRTDYGIRQWRRNINMKAYGDDIIFTIHPECATWFDLTLLTEIYTLFGVPVTPADKSDAGLVLKELKDLTFLKRTFVPFDHPYVKWQGALDKVSIRNMVQFYRLKPNNGTIEDAVITNCEESVKEAYHWGKTFFDEHRNKLNDWFRRNGYPPLDITFKELDIQFRDKIRNF